VFAAKDKSAQPEFWIAAAQVAKPAKSAFYAKLEETLESFGFAAQVRTLCAPAYKAGGAGRPGIDPVVYLKMMMVGFFENLPSERAIAARCDDSIAIREFLHYDLTEATPDHSSLSIIRQRLKGPVYEQVFTLVLSALSEHGLLRGKNLGIDSSVLEANASLRGLVNRNTGEAYWDYVKRLASESGVDPEDSAACGEASGVLTVETATADKGYFEVSQLQALQQEQIKTVICDPISNRRLDKLNESEEQAVKAARRSTQSKYGQKLLRRRGMHLERAFAHILDCGGMRRATLRGRQNLNKRFKLAAAFYNLSQLMRHLFGIGTPKQCEAMGAGGLGAVLGSFALWLMATVVHGTSITSKEVKNVTWFGWSSQPMEKAAGNEYS
jgi:transposase